MLGFDKIVVRGFKKGSIITNADVPIPDGQGASAVFNSISNNLIMNKNIPGLTLLSSTLVAKNFDPTSGDQVNLALILGLSIPAFILGKFVYYFSCRFDNGNCL
jgi:hypothetical protein